MKENEMTREAAEHVDWRQVVLNGGPPCFHQEGGRFCGRAQRWDGHQDRDDYPYHRFVSLADLLARQLDELDSLRADKKSLTSALQSCAEVVGDVSAFGSCDCDIPAGKTCVVCEAALVLKTATEALDSARKGQNA